MRKLLRVISFITGVSLLGVGFGIAYAATEAVGLENVGFSGGDEQEMIGFADELFSIGFGQASPEVTTSAATGITGAGATLNGSLVINITPVTLRGFIWDTSSHAGTTGYTSDWYETSSGFSSGSFSHAISGLSAGTTYYFRAYATNTDGTDYGSELNFTATATGLPTVTTGSASSITQNGATLGLTISSIGSSTVTAIGFQYGLTTSYGSTVSGSGTYPVGSYTLDVSTLQIATTYHFRAYATNTQGTSYGADATFTTLSGYPLLTTNAVTNISAVSATFNGNITDIGGSNCTARGFKYGTSSGNYIYIGTQSGNFGTGTYSMNVATLTASTTYYVVAYDTNSVGTAYGAEISDVLTVI